MRSVKLGTTDVSTIVRIVDATDGTPETGVVAASAGLALWYRREGAALVALTESDLAAVDSAHSDGGLKHISDGYYRVDLPDAACGSGVTGVAVGGAVTGMVVIGSYHPLVAYDPQDTIRLGLTALPNAAADAAGGLIISDAGGLDADDLKADVTAILADTGTDGVVVNAAGLAADAVTEIQSGLATAASIAALNNISAAQVNAEVVDALSTDAQAEPTSVPAANASLAAKINHLFLRFRNKREQTSSAETLYQDDAATVYATASKADDGTTFTKGEDTTA